MKRRLLSYILLLAMVLSMFPAVTVTAATENPAFTIQPVGGNVGPGSSMLVSWELNFEPKLLCLCECDYTGDIGSEENIGNTTTSKYLPATSYGYRLKAYYTFEDYILSDRFYVKHVVPTITKQPVGGYVQTGKSLTVSWELNFIPTNQSLSCYDSNGKLMSDAMLGDTARSAQVTDSPYVYYINAYYGTNNYVRSEPFYVTEIDPVFSVQPVGGDTILNEKLNVSWKTNFTPTMLQLVKVRVHPVDGEIPTYENLSTSATSVEIAPGYDYYTIRAYYNSSQRIHSQTFYVTSKAPYTVDSEFAVGGKMEIDSERIAESNDSWMTDYFDNKITYQWYRNGVAISGATGHSYTLTESDGGKEIYATVKGSSKTLNTPVKAIPAVSYGIYVGGVGMMDGQYLANGASAVTSTKPSSGGYAYYKDNVLTLNNFNCSGSYNDDLIKSDNAINLVLVGKNTLATIGTYADGIDCYDGSVNISGTGSLEIDVAGDAIYADGNVTVTDATLTVNGGYYGIYAYGYITLDNATVTMKDVEYDGIYADYSVEIKDSTVNIACGDEGIYAYDDMTVTGSTVTVNTDDASLCADNVTITGSTVTATSGYVGIEGSDEVCITGSTVAASADCAGIYGDSRISITDSNVIAKSTATEDDDLYWAIYTDTEYGGIIVIDSNLKVQASTEPNGTLGTYDPEKHNTYDYIKITAAKDGWVEENGKWYFYKDGAKATGWLKDGGKWYYLGSDGAMTTGWQKVDGKWYYLNNYMKTGWQSIGGKWYYLNTEMKTGWQSIGGKWYYLGTNGAMTTGWQQVGGKWYYMNSSGVMQTGWQKISGKWYYLNSEMKTGWQSIGGKWYYLGTNGAMTTGWQQVGGKWYYMNSSGVMETGWVYLGGKWYFLDDNGVMATGTRVINGETYKFNSSGVWIA